MATIYLMTIHAFHVQVLMFPDLLDDQAIANEFVPFILEVEKSHDLTLTRSQQYPVL